MLQTAGAVLNKKPSLLPERFGNLERADKE
jgi:hypothetical protein